MKKLIATVIAAAMLMSMLTIVSFAGQANTWGSSIGDVFLDGANQEVGYRFAVQGSGSLIAIYPYIAGSADSKFDFKIYEWAGNYSDTVSTTPVYSSLEVAFNGGWTSYTDGFAIPSGTVTAGEWLAVMDNYQNVGWSIRNYVFGPKDGFKVYSSGVEYKYDDASTTIKWQFDFEADTWFKSSLSEDTEPTPSLDPVEPTAIRNTWGEGIGMGNDRFDGVGTAEVGYRFVTTGSNGKLVAIIPFMAGTAGEFDCFVYAWNTDYATTVTADPLVVARDIEFDGSTWNTFENRNVNSKIYLGSGLDAGEYLAVLTNFENTTWAICSYRMAPSSGFRAYFNGVPAEYEGGYKSLAWQLGFTGDGSVSRTELVDPVEAPDVSELRISYADADADDKIDAFYLNAVVKADVTDTVGIVFSDTEASCKFVADGGNPLFSRACTKYDALVQSACYGQTVITAENLGGEEGDKLISVHWLDLPTDNLANGSTLYARTFIKSADGTITYQDVVSFTLVEGTSSNSIV